MKISVITVCYDAVDTIQDAIHSVANQTYNNVEYIVVDGASKDGTLEIIQDHESVITKWVSEPDRGIYDAMNKGISMASGNVIGFLNADDLYAHSDVVAKISATMSTKDIDACFGDVVFVRSDLNTTVRYYCSRKFSPKKLAYGWMPAHPTLFLKNRLFKKYGVFKTDYRIAADFELVARLFWKHGIKYRYLPGVSVKMRVGGVSTSGVRSNFILSREIVRACKENGINTSLPKVFLKYPMKLLELINCPS